MASQFLKHEESDLSETQLQIQHGTPTPLVTPDHTVAMAERGVLTACTGHFFEQHSLPRAKEGISLSQNCSSLDFSSVDSYLLVLNSFLLLHLLCNYV